MRAATVKSRKEFDRRWNGKSKKFLNAHSPSKPYVLYLNNGNELLKVFGFANSNEFFKGCEKMSQYAKNSLPSCLYSEVDDLAIDLPREWEHLPQKISGEAFFTGVAYLGDKIRKVLFQEEILYIILKIQQRIKEYGAIEAIQNFESEDGVKIICSDTMKGKSDGWKMSVNPY